MIRVKTYDQFLNEVYDGDSGWAKRGHGGYGYLSGGSISGGWEGMDKKKPSNTPEEIAEAHKTWLDKCKKNGVYVLDGEDFYLEHATDEFAYFTQKKWTDEFDPAGCDSIAHMFEMVGSALKDNKGKINDYRQVEMPAQDNNGKKVPVTK